MQLAAKFFSEQTGPDIVVPTVNGKDNHASGQSTDGVKSLSVGNVPGHSLLKMHVPEAIQIGEGKLKEHLITSPPAACGAEIRSQGAQVTDHGSALRSCQKVNDQRNRPYQDQGCPSRGKAHDAQQLSSQKSPMQTRLS